MKDKLVHSMWGNVDCDLSTVNAIGQSRGILTIWKKEAIYPLYSLWEMVLWGLMYRGKC